LWGSREMVPGLEIGPIDPVLTLMWVIGGLCAVAAAHQAKFYRLAALIFMSGAGLVTCITFLWFSAPDLALTQLLVELVTTVLILLGLRWLPKRIEQTDGAADSPTLLRRHRDFAMAAVAGLGAGALAYFIMLTPPNHS